MIIDWNVHIETDFKGTPEIKIIEAVPGDFKIIFITASTWEDATDVRNQILREEE